MNDIVERLRDHGWDEAAAEIERLRKAVDLENPLGLTKAKDMLEKTAASYAKAVNEIEKIRRLRLDRLSRGMRTKVDIDDPQNWEWALDDDGPFVIAYVSDYVYYEEWVGYVVLPWAGGGDA